MMLVTAEPVRSGYCIFLNTVCEGIVPAWSDERGLPVIYETEVEAQKEIAELTIARLQEFLEGERLFGDAMTVEDFVLAVDVWPDGSISTEDGTVYGKQLRN